MFIFNSILQSYFTFNLPPYFCILTYTLNFFSFFLHMKPQGFSDACVCSHRLGLASVYLCRPVSWLAPLHQQQTSTEALDFKFTSNSECKLKKKFVFTLCITRLLFIFVFTLLDAHKNVALLLIISFFFVFTQELVGKNRTERLV